MDYVEHLETLGLEPGASPEEIRRAFRERSADWHPDRLPDSPSFQRDAARARKELETSYRFLMDRYGLDVGDLEPRPTLRTMAPPKAEERKEKRPPAPPRRRVPLVRMLAVTGGVFIVAAVVVPEARREGFAPMLRRWADHALEFSTGKLSSLRSLGGEESGEATVRSDGRSVESLPRLTKAQVLERYGAPRLRESGKWTYAGFEILFQDDSVASLLVRDPPRRN